MLSSGKRAATEATGKTSRVLVLTSMIQSDSREFSGKHGSGVSSEGCGAGYLHLHKANPCHHKVSSPFSVRGCGPVSPSFFCLPSPKTTCFQTTHPNATSTFIYDVECGGTPHLT